MKRLLLLIGVFFVFAASSFGQTSLSAGDIVISVYNEDDDDKFSFVLLTDIESGTEIIFTDNGWFPEADSFRTGEGEVTWTATSALPKGTEITINDPGDVGSGISANYGSVSESENGFSIAAGSGDQIIAFQGTLASPTSIIYMFDSSTSGLETTDAAVTANEDSGLPTGLTEGANAYVHGSASQDNFQYNCPTIADATASNILASFMGSSNYNTNTTNALAAIGCNYRDVTITGSAGWRLLSMPIGSATVNHISDDTAIQGIMGGDDASADANFYIYDNTGAFEEPTDVSTAWGNGFGFALYFFNNSSNGSSALPVTLDASGLESDPCITVNTSTTPGSVGTGGTGETNSHYTLLGNPFSTNYNLNDMSVEVDDYQNEVQFWNAGSNTYEQGDISSSYIVAPWQGFWVEMANGQDPGQICMGTLGKTASDTTATYFSKSTANRGDITFSLSSDATMDKALKLAVRDYATLEYDRADASKLIPLITEYATMAFKSNERLKSVESLPWNLDEEVKIDLEEQLVGVSGEFTLDWSGMETIPSDWTITFHDYKAGANIDMRSESKYVFEATGSSNQKVNPLSILKGPAAVEQKSKSEGNRFGITITPNTTSVNNEEEVKVEGFALSQNYPNPFNPTTTINYSVENAGPVTISIYNLMGQKVAELVNESKAAGSYNVTWNAANAASGMYYYRLESAGQTLTRKMTLIK